MNDQTDHKGSLKFDPTINAGHLLTFAGFIVSGFIAYSGLDKRLAVVETRTVLTDQRAQENEARMSVNLQEIKRDVKETNQTLNQLARDLISKQK